ncbi:MAG: YihY/virulence factor BrkB family protein [Pseudorhodoplanes sp.]|jgi:membrane protein|nr:YihY/virulence factor BrkB family protein [Pseudorhodoplanes sp.]
MPRKKPSKIPLWLSAAALAGVTGLALLLERQPRRSPGEARDAGPFGGASSRDAPRHVQARRARQPGRGRFARSPWAIPWRGWKDIFWRTYEEFGNDRLLAVAAGVVFYGLLAIFPAVTALVSSYGLFADAATVGRHLTFAAALMPEGAFGIVEEQINRIAAQGGGGLSLGFIFGLGLAIWSANAGMKAIMDALNVIYDEEEKRSFIKLNLMSLALTLGALASLLIAIGSVIVFPLMLNWLGLGGAVEWTIAVLRWPALLFVVMFGLAILYRFGPSRREARWQWLSIGAVLATLLWLTGSLLFSWYLSNFADYNATYGSLGAGIGLMMWLWLSTISILLGAELNSEIEHQTARDSTVGGDKPLGRRGAAMADTVGKAQR